MSDSTPAASSSGYHDGELAVQQRAGVRAEARRLSRMLDAAELTRGIAEFLAQRTLAVVTGRDGHGQLWTSPLAGPSGFLQVVDPGTLRIHAAPGVGDPLHGLQAGQPLALVAIEFAKSRRFRINGRLTGADPTMLTVEVDQAYGNCPQYIQQRVLRPRQAPRVTPSRHWVPEAGNALTPEVLQLIRGADTFFLGTVVLVDRPIASHVVGQYVWLGVGWLVALAPRMASGGQSHVAGVHVLALRMLGAAGTPSTSTSSAICSTTRTWRSVARRLGR